MQTKMKSPAAPVSAARPVMDRALYVSVPDIDPLEINAVVGLLYFAEVCEHLRELGAAPSMLFADETIALLAERALDDAPIVYADLPDDRAHWIALQVAECRPDLAWSAYALGRLAEERARQWAPLTLAWAREALERKWTTPSRIRAEVDRTLALAAGEGVAA